MIDLDNLSYNERELIAYNNVISRCKTISNYIIDYDMTIRQVAENMCVSKSLVHKYIHTYIKCYFDEEFVQIMRKLNRNKQYKFKPRKYW